MNTIKELLAHKGITVFHFIDYQGNIRFTTATINRSNKLSDSNRSDLKNVLKARSNE